jgi:hypothetical protein
MEEDQPKPLWRIGVLELTMRAPRKLWLGPHLKTLRRSSPALPPSKEGEQLVREA